MRRADRVSPKEAAVTNDVTMQLLSEHVPVTLLLDVTAPPDSYEVFVAEGGDADWLVNLHFPAA